MQHPPFAAAWMAQWRRAAIALQRVADEDARALTAATAQAATVALHSLPTTLPAGRWESSGLVEQQRLFARARGAVPAAPAPPRS